MRRHYMAVCTLLATMWPIAALAYVLTPDEFKQMAAIQKANEDRLFKRFHIIGIGIGTEPTQAVFRIYLKPDGNAPDKLDKYDVRKIFITRELGILAAQMGTSTSNGVVINNNCSAGTLGMMVTSRIPPHRPGYITSNHVAALTNPSFCPNGGLTSSEKKEFAPGLFDTVPKCEPSRATKIGTLQYPPVPIDFNGNDNYVDAAFVDSIQGTVDAHNACGICTDNVSVIKPLDILDKEVQKCGRTTCLTTGFVREINVTFDAYYCLGAKAHFVKQLRVEQSGFSKRGDSGAVVFGKDGGLVGLVFYGDDDKMTWLNPMQEVLNELKVDPLPVPCGPKTCSPQPPPPLQLLKVKPSRRH